MIGKLIDEMIVYFGHDRKQIHHLLQVYGFAKTIGELEKLDSKTQEILELTAVIHDIGIKISMEKYQSSVGPYQELEGPPEARKILEKLGYNEEIIERVCYIVGHHHTYTDIQGLDYQIMVEADFLVNIKTEKYTQEAIDKIRDNIFKTNAGKQILKTIFY